MTSAFSELSSVTFALDFSASQRLRGETGSWFSPCCLRVFVPPWWVLLLVAAQLRCVLSGKVFDFSFGFQRSSAQISGEKVLIFSPCLRVSVVGFGFCLWLCYACGLRLKTFTCKLQWLAFAG